MATSWVLLLIAVAAGAMVACTTASPQPNPPTFPDTVQVFSPTDTDIQAKVDAAFATNGGHQPADHGQFSSARFSFLFKPGKYAQDVPVGFYTTVAGLGDHPDDVEFTGAKGVYCEEGNYYYAGGALDTFWRAAENFQSDASFAWAGMTGGMLWATSQATPLRRVHVNRALSLYEYQPPYQAAGYSSGGFMASCQVEGKVTPGSQQQYIARNSAFGEWVGGNWNMVHVGNKGAPSAHCGNSQPGPFVVEPNTPVMAEKPFLSVDGQGKFYISVPALKTNSQGPGWDTPVTKIGFEQVFVAQPSQSASDINVQLAAGLHVVLTPGIYNLTAPLQLTHSNQMVLGLGFATLVSVGGTPVIQVADGLDGVRIVGSLLLQAGAKPTTTLLQWGTPGSRYPGKASNPGFIYDVFARVGGPDTYPVQAETMVRIDSGNVVGDNFWLWRADHTVSGSVRDSANPCNHGLQVFGDNVTFYGLAVEHTLQDLVQWNGNNGQVFFYQSELPYDVTQSNFGDKGFVGYRVAANVTSHRGLGVAVYHFFRDNPVTVASGISCPTALESSFVSPLTVFLNGQGTITHVLNDKGPTSTGPQGGTPQYICP